MYIIYKEKGRGGPDVKSNILYIRFLKICCAELNATR